MESERPGVPLWQLTLRDFLHWVEMAREEEMSAKSIAKCISHVRGFLNYTWRGGRIDRNVLDGFSLHDAQVRQEQVVLSREEAKRLILSCAQQTSLERRDRLIILMLYGCGLRTDELRMLNLQDVATDQQEITVIGKGDKQRCIPVPDGVWTALLAHMVERRGKRGPLLRTAAKKKRLQPITICEIVKAAVEKAGINKKVTPKTLRHTFGSHLVDCGVGIPVVASLMGHHSIKETSTYLHAMPGRREDAVRLLCGSSSPEKGVDQ